MVPFVANKWSLLQEAKAMDNVMDFDALVFQFEILWVELQCQYFINNACKFRKKIQKQDTCGRNIKKYLDVK